MKLFNITPACGRQECFSPSSSLQTRTSGDVGSYFAYEGADASKLGISTEGRVLKTFRLTENVKILESYTSDIAGHKGGEKQIFNLELKGKIEEIK